VFRLVGGKISKTNAIAITTPSSTIGIRGGITIFSVTQNQTTADFVFGNSMTVTAGGKTETATRAGSQVITNAGGVPGVPTLLKPGSLSAALSNLEGAKSNSNNSPDQSAQNSGFSKGNSGQSANAPNFNQNGPPNTNNNTLTNAVSFSNPAGQPLGNSTLQIQPKTNTVTITNAVSTTIIPNNNPPTPNNNPTPPPSGSTPTTQFGFAPPIVVIDQPGGDGDRYSRHVRALSLQGAVSITTDAANNQAIGTIVVGVNGSHEPAIATLQLSGTGNGTSVAMANDPSRPSTLQIDGRTYQINPTTTLASASNPACTCEFLSWGWWKSSVADPRNNGKTYTALGTYVAGTPSVQLPMTGIATYNGFMAGYAQKGGNAPYQATGSYQNAWNFQTGQGDFTGSFDRRNFSGTTYTTGGTTFAGNFNSVGGHHHRSGSLSGGFFSSPTDAAAYQAGTFSIGNARSRYQASGVFAGQR
jgi:hypothetical protein